MLSTGHTFTICTPRRGRGEGESLLRHGQFIGSAFVDAVDTIQELVLFLGHCIGAQESLLY